jgi:hypothetical protein
MLAAHVYFEHMNLEIKSKIECNYSFTCFKILSYLCKKGIQRELDNYFQNVKHVGGLHQQQATSAGNFFSASRKSWVPGVG